jgi:long-subunit acyl-CoA synthetase (AMP-forming)
MKGYFDDPARTAAVLDADGWLRTGDLGIVDDDDYLRLIGRIKDIVRVGGENVAAARMSKAFSCAMKRSSKRWLWACRISGWVKFAPRSLS